MKFSEMANPEELGDRMAGKARVAVGILTDTGTSTTELGALTRHCNSLHNGFHFDPS
jgi:hypothetical protein